MISWQNAAKLGVVVAFLAIPIGSYYVIRGYVEENQRLKDSVSQYQEANKMLNESIVRMENQRKLEEQIDAILQQSFEAVGNVVQTIRDRSRQYEDQTSSDVLKETIRVLKENVK